MLPYLWTALVAVALLSGALRGTQQEVSAAAMNGAAQAITISLSLAGPLCLWSGVGELMSRSGLRDRLSAFLTPLLGQLFPRLRRKKDGFSALCCNVTANLLGLGNAATPMGILACKAMGDGSGRATREQCRLIVMNTASIQLLPTTVSALRAGLGAHRPLDILPAVLLSSLVSVSSGLLFCRLLEKHCG